MGAETSGARESLYYGAAPLRMQSLLSTFNASQILISMENPPPLSGLTVYKSSANRLAVMDKCTWSAYLCSAEAPVKKATLRREWLRCVLATMPISRAVTRWQTCLSLLASSAPSFPLGLLPTCARVPGRAYRERDGARRAGGSLTASPLCRRCPAPGRRLAPGDNGLTFRISGLETHIYKDLKVFCMLLYAEIFLYAYFAQASQTSVGGPCRDRAPPSVACRRGLRARRCV